MTIRLVALSLSIATSLIVVGCTNRPVPELRPVETQLSLESAAHWNALAAETADEIAAHAKGNAVVINPGAETSFGQAFGNLLETHLVRSGVKVLPSGSAGMQVKYDVQVVDYPGNRPFRTMPGGYTAAGVIGAGAVGTALASGAGAVALGVATGGAILVGADAHKATYSALDDVTAEVIITTTMSGTSGPIMRKSSIFYIRPREVALYHLDASPEPVQPVYPTAHRYSVVSK